MPHGLLHHVASTRALLQCCLLPLHRTPGTRRTTDTLVAWQLACVAMSADYWHPHTHIPLASQWSTEGHPVCHTTCLVAAAPVSHTHEA